MNPRSSKAEAALLPLWGRGTSKGWRGRRPADLAQSSPLPRFAGTPPNGRRGALIVALLALLLAGCDTHSSDEAFGKRVRAYLLSHPEVLQEAGQRLEAKMAADEAADQKRAAALLPSLRPAIERDPRDFVANPLGTITVTEFYDYRCPHCANAAPKVVGLIRADPDVRFVFKEMPIFGPTSEHAARAALATRKAGGDSLGLYQAFMSARPLRDDAIDPLARAKGADPRDLTPAAAPRFDAQLAATGVLFNRLALGGTPAFIIGDKIILGEDMDAVEAAVRHARAKRT